MKKKVLSLLITFAMLFSMLPATALAAEPAVNGEIVNVDATNAQDVLDGKYGDITGNVELDGKYIAEGCVLNADSEIEFVDRIEIANLDDLVAFQTSVNNGRTYEGVTVSLIDDIALTDEWTSIGNAAIDSPSYKGNAFKGTFDGGGHTISGLTNSLFGVVDGATIKDLELSDVSITGSNERVGAAVGMMVGNATVSNITVSGAISGAKYVGGIVGALTYEGTIEDCTNEATISGSTYNIGGIVGAAYYTAEGKTMTVSGCTNNGAVSGPYGVGGIVGLSTADISNCTNTAAITASNMDIGGIVGEQKVAGSVIGCTNTGNVTNSGSGYGTGGIIGWVRYLGYPGDDYGFGEMIEVSGNQNSGVIKGGNDAGGIIGVVYNAAEVTGNENTAPSIEATTFAAGIVGSAQFTENVGNGIPKQELNVQNNISTTPLDSITASCKDLYVYDNSSGSQEGEIKNNGEAWVAQVGDMRYTSLQTAIVAAAPAGTVELLTDVMVDKWVMFTESLTIGDDRLITTKIDGLTINGNGRTLTIKSIESAGNGNRLFYDATNLNISDLTITYIDSAANQGGIGLTSGTINNVAINGGVYGVLPGTGVVTIEDCTFKTNGAAIYYETARDDLTVTGNTFELPENANVILLRGTETFTNNTIMSGRTVNVVSGSPVVSENTFADGVRLKVYDDATAEITNNTITCLAFEDDSTAVKSTFAGNTLSDDAKAALAAKDIENPFIVSIVIPEGAAIVMKDADANDVAPAPNGSYLLNDGTYTYTVSKSGYYTKSDQITVDNANVELTVSLTPRSSGGGGGSASYAITVEGTKNGDITVSPSRASSSTTVTITADPDSGYELDELMVLDKNDKKVDLTKKSDNKYTFKMPSGKVTIEATFIEIEDDFDNPFVDVAEGTYYYEAVLWAAANGITGGTSATTFSPAATCTRAQIATFLWRVAGSPKPVGSTNPFADVGVGAYYARAVQWAYEQEITGGTSATTFSPDADCTRGQMATFLWRAAGSPKPVGSTNPFTDVSAGAYYAKAVQWAYEQKITGGTTVTTFSPNDPCTRAQMVTFLYRFPAD